VVELTDKNFNQVLADAKRPALIEFYTPWCGYCKKLEPEWELLAKTIKNGGDKVLIGKVNCEKYANFASTKFNIAGYPTILYFPDGPEKHWPYNSNDRDADSFIEYLNEFADIKQPYLKERPKVVDVATDRFERIIKDTSKALLVGFYDPKDPNCIMLAPIYDELGGLFEEVKELLFVRFNSEAYEAREIKRKYKITKYPTALFFPKDRKGNDLDDTTPYKDLLVKEQMIKFLNLNLNLKETGSGTIPEMDELIEKLILGDNSAIFQAELMVSSFEDEEKLKFGKMYSST